MGVTHSDDGARPGVRLTMCGTCLREFPGKTAQESADAARAHIEAGCTPRRIVVTAKDPDVDPKMAAVVEAYVNATIDDATLDTVIEEAVAAALEEMLWG
jgi:hypothetical protein